MGDDALDALRYAAESYQNRRNREVEFTLAAMRQAEEEYLAYQRQIGERMTSGRSLYELTDYPSLIPKTTRYDAPTAQWGNPWHRPQPPGGPYYNYTSDGTAFIAYDPGSQHEGETMFNQLTEAELDAIRSTVEVEEGSVVVGSVIDDDHQVMMKTNTSEPMFMSPETADAVADLLRQRAHAVRTLREKQDRNRGRR